ncbi:hypothetical protein [Spiroplasma endosymbiont of Ammophila pubescens]|uniref:hypothetical protein n=1 Tax=Spiroplasma endosymbiont of Ammophila pubescens TaxID=3066315 RepID=UPI0032B27C5F
MKKLLNLLSVLISGTTTPALIANSNFQKYEEIKTNDFKTNKLNRIKRQTKFFNENEQITFDIGRYLSK